jgi:hypothetical protein
MRRLNYGIEHYEHLSPSHSIYWRRDPRRRWATLECDLIRSGFSLTKPACFALLALLREHDACRNSSISPVYISAPRVPKASLDAVAAAVRSFVLDENNQAEPVARRRPGHRGDSLLGAP